MNKVSRVLLLGAVAVGIVLALTAAPSSGGVRGQVTGYGDDVLQPCKSGQVASDGCLQAFETEVAEAAGSTSDDSGNTAMYVMFGIGALVVIGGVIFFFNKSDFASRFKS